VVALLVDSPNQPTVPPDMITFNDNGGWSWFQGPRVVVDSARGTILISSVASGSGTDGATRKGNVEVVAYDFITRTTQRAVLHDNFQADDHNSAALHIRPDGRYVAMYAKHFTDSFSRWRVSTNPHDATSWSPEQTFNNQAGTTYSNIYAIPTENGGKGRLYNFTRTLGWDPHFLISDDFGSTWMYGGRLLNDTGTNAIGHRPYVRYASDEATRVHFIATDGHPRYVANSLYYGFIRSGQLFRSDGTVADSNLFDGSAVAPSDLTTIYTGDTDHRAWPIDIQIDAQGRPYIAFSVRVPPAHAPPEGKHWDHHYYYGYFDGTGWHVTFMAHAGSELYESEGDYTGLVALDPHNACRVFISTDVDPVTAKPLISSIDGKRHYEIFEGRTSDNGTTWSWRALTANSEVNNIRPIVPNWKSAHTLLLWLRGTYTNYTNYDLNIVGTIIPSSQAESCLHNMNS
jgi:hypothetical protein